MCLLHVRPAVLIYLFTLSVYKFASILCLHYTFFSASMLEHICLKKEEEILFWQQTCNSSKLPHHLSAFTTARDSQKVMCAQAFF